ncbi:MAG: NUDIX domain-containing protein [Acidobacteriota bacterium]
MARHDRDVVPVEKVLVYIQHEGRLLVLRHPEHPEAGVQVPGGTRRSGEEPEVAALREAREETGLTGLRIVRLLGMTEHDMRPFGKDETHRRHVFELALDDEPPERWHHHEDDPEGGGAPILFELSWEPLSELPELIAGHGELVDRLC